MKTEIISTKYSVKNLARKVKTLDPDKSYNYSILFENEIKKYFTSRCWRRHRTKYLQDFVQIKWIQKTVGTDININSASSLMLDKFYRVPKCDLEYIEKISQIIEDENISLILPVSESEISYFFQNTIDSINNIPLILPNFYSLSIGLDKLKTIKFLMDNNLCPKTQAKLQI